MPVAAAGAGAAAAGSACATAAKQTPWRCETRLTRLIGTRAEVKGSTAPLMLYEERSMVLEAIAAHYYRARPGKLCLDFGLVKSWTCGGLGHRGCQSSPKPQAGGGGHLQRQAGTYQLHYCPQPASFRSQHYTPQGGDGMRQLAHHHHSRLLDG